MKGTAKTRTRLLAANRPARSARSRRRTRRGEKLLSVVPVVSQFQTGTGYGISASEAPGAASGAAGEKVTRSHKATKIPSLRGFVASCENTTDYVSESGEVVASYAYDAFGRTLSATGPMADVFPFRFSTKYYDSETGLYYYGRRYYSPDLGRWLNRDPIEEEGGVNLYAFCGNNGVGAFDALGLFVLKKLKSFLGQYGKITLWSCDSAKSKQQCRRLDDAAKKLYVEIHAKDDMVRSGPDLGAWLDRFAIRFVNAISFWSKSDEKASVPKWKKYKPFPQISAPKDAVDGPPILKMKKEFELHLKR